MFDLKLWNRQASIIADVLERSARTNRELRIPDIEFKARQAKIWQMLEREGYDCGIVYSDEHYCGDVPYLAGNNNIIVEPVACVIGKNGFVLFAGLESGLVAEQLCHRSGTPIMRTDIFKVDWGKDYPKKTTRPEEVFEAACGKKPRSIALLTTRAVVPASIYRMLISYVGEDCICDISEQYYALKYEKSDTEMELISQSSRITDAMIEGMLSVLRPGMYETQLAGWGCEIAHELGAEALAFPMMVTAGRNNRTTVGRCTNTVIHEGDVVSIGAAVKCDGLSGAQRISVMCVSDPGKVTEQYKKYMLFLEDAFRFSFDKFIEIAHKKLPANLHEQAMIDYYDSRSAEFVGMDGKPFSHLSRQKGYVTTHNTGYTECQEFYGAMAGDFSRSLPAQMATMLDVGILGYENSWDNDRLPDLDYIVIEKTLGKRDDDVKILNSLPINLQHFVGRGF